MSTAVIVGHESPSNLFYNSFDYQTCMTHVLELNFINILVSTTRYIPYRLAARDELGINKNQKSFQVLTYPCRFRTN